MNKGAFAYYAAHMLEGGYSPVPIRPGQKRPLMDGWDGLRSEALTANAIAQLVRQHPGLGLGVAGGYNCLVPVDVDADEEAVIDAVAKTLPIPGVVKTGQRGFTAFYRSSRNIRAQKMKRGSRMLVEVLATGQTVIPPTAHLDTKRPYRWQTKATLFNTMIDELSEITQEQIDALAQKLDCGPKFEPWISKRGPVTQAAAGKRISAFARRCLENDVRRLTQSRRGTRNPELFRAACNLGKYKHHGVLPEGEIVSALMGACASNGLLKEDGQRQCLQTINSGLERAKGDALPDLPDRPRRVAFGQRSNQ
jgi:hypothetical protein